MQADDLRFGEQLRQLHVPCAKRLDLGIGVGVIGQELAAETVHDFREGRTDLSGADHADSLAHQIETGQPVQGEITLACAVVRAVQAPVQRQDQRHRMFGHRVGRIGRHPNDHQPQAFGHGQVDVVVTGRAQGDQAGTAGRQLFEHGSAEVIVDEGADHLELLGQRHGVQAQPCRLEMQLDAGRKVDAQKTVAVVGLAAEKNRTHALFLWGKLQSCL
ncbi:hypothetical protein D3C73_1179960 [compost metagenome]